MNILYLYVNILDKLFSSMFSIQKKHSSAQKGHVFFDTIGIGLFTILGIQKTLELDLEPIFALLMGVVSSVFGGVLRGVLTNIVPLIFRKGIYAISCVIGGIFFLVIYKFSNEHINILASMELLL